MKRELTTLCASVLLTSCVQTRPHDHVCRDSESPAVDVTAVLAGYKSLMNLSTGQRVPVYTIDPEQAKESSSFLFSVLTPTNMTGRYFTVHYCGPRISDPSRLFKPITRYRFTVLNSDLMEHKYEVCSLEQGITEVPITKEEFDGYMKILDADEAYYKQSIIRYEKQKSDKSKETVRMYKQCLTDLDTRRKKVKDLLNQAEAMPIKQHD